MARIRTLKPEFWQDEKLCPLPDAHRLLFLFLVSSADDMGRLLDKPIKIEADMFDGNEDRSRDIREGLANLARIGRIRRGKTASGQRIIEIANWAKHQKVDHPNIKGSFPEIVEVQEVTDIRERFANDSREIREPLAHHTNDQRPTTSTNDQGSQVRGKRARPSEKQWPDFPTEVRREMHAVWTEKVGAVNFPLLVNAIGPYWRPGEKAAVVSRAVRDYCATITRGRSAPFASPADLGKKLGALIQNVERNATDPVARADGAETIIHGKVAA